MDRLAAVEGSLESIQNALRELLLNTQNPPPAPAPAVPAPAPGPDFSAPTQLQIGRMFLHSVLTYYRLVPEAFMADGFVSQKNRPVRMSFMSKDTAARWAEQRASAVPFAFPTWAQFEAEFRLRFVEENKQDQALTELSPARTGRNGRLLGPLVRVTKHRSGLDPKINVAITTSGTAPDLTDYNGWRARFPPVEAFAKPDPETLRFGSRPLYLGRVERESSQLRPPHALWSSRPARSHAPVSGAVRPDTSPANALSPRTFGMQTFSTRSFVNSDDLLDELFARLSTSASLPAESLTEMKWNWWVFPARPNSDNSFDSEVVARGAPPVPVSVRVTETLPSVPETEARTAPEPGTRAVTEAPVPKPGTRTGSLRRVHRPKWERRLPRQYVIDSVEGRNSLHIPLDLHPGGPPRLPLTTLARPRGAADDVAVAPSAADPWREAEGEGDLGRGCTGAAVVPEGDTERDRGALRALASALTPQGAVPAPALRGARGGGFLLVGSSGVVVFARGWPVFSALLGFFFAARASSSSVSLSRAGRPYVRVPVVVVVGGAALALPGGLWGRSVVIVAAAVVVGAALALPTGFRVGASLSFSRRFRFPVALVDLDALSPALPLLLAAALLSATKAKSLSRWAFGPDAASDVLPCCVMRALLVVIHAPHLLLPSSSSSPAHFRLLPARVDFLPSPASFASPFLCLSAFLLLSVASPFSTIFLNSERSCFFWLAVRTAHLQVPAFSASRRVRSGPIADCLDIRLKSTPFGQPSSPN
ncbi:hypothetical protein B0H14DRAFT_3491391 [Mycena olivaceomarginata]|nr:hypothetical protein B0H14DRAFT_3491391 [Mycena olivaceomarginata]